MPRLNRKYNPQRIKRDSDILIFRTLMELHDDFIHIATGNGMKATRREQRGKFPLVRRGIKKFPDGADSEIGDEGRGAFLREMKRVLCIYGRWRVVSRESFYWA